MRKPKDGAWKWDTQKDETTVTIPGGPAHIVGLDPGEVVVNIERVKEIIADLENPNVRNRWDDLKKELGIE